MNDTIMTLVNLTPHAVNIVDNENNPLYSVAPSGVVARVTCETVITGYITVKNGDTLVNIPETENTYGEVQDLPDPIPGTLYCVSRMIKDACPNRTDLRIPNQSVRNDQGQIIGCLSLSRA